MDRPWLVASPLVLAVTVYAGCAHDSVVIAEQGTADAGTPPPTFDPPPDDAGVDRASPPPPVAMCIATECPANYTTCPSWDGSLVQKCSTNLLTDSENCGACGNFCPPSFGSLNMMTRCVQGSCQRECLSEGASEQNRDCNGLVDDGCEVNVAADAENCGACGNKCPSGQRCFDGKCGCPGTQTDCGELVGCTDTSRDDFNCGVCGNHCVVADDAPSPPANMEYGCGNSKCGELHCTSGYREAWANCNSTLDDGCETNTATDPNNCGTCGNKCAPGQFCMVYGFEPPKCACDPGQTLCGSGNSRFCADVQNDAGNCGACGHVCPGSIRHGSPICKKGFCDYVCDQGFGDCDGDPSNGCETDLGISGANCGGCGIRCDTSAGQPCIEGKCLMTECDAGVLK